MNKALPSPIRSKFLHSGFLGVNGVNPTVARFHSTSSFYSFTPTANQETVLRSGLDGDKKDFSTRAASSNFQELNHALISASLAHQHSSYRAVAYEMNLKESGSLKANYDKVLLFVSHGDAAIRKNDPLGVPVLTGKGVGQSLTLSHQTAVFCSDSLSPDLFVLAPEACSIQTALYAFPYNTPDAVRRVPWVCHGDLVADENASDELMLRQAFGGIDYSLCKSSAGSHKHEDFLTWLESRREQVIVVSSSSEWLHSFCKNTVDYVGHGRQFQAGEMRAVGLNFMTRTMSRGVLLEQTKPCTLPCLPL